MNFIEIKYFVQAFKMLSLEKKASASDIPSVVFFKFLTEENLEKVESFCRRIPNYCGKIYGFSFSPTPIPKFQKYWNSLVNLRGNVSAVVLMHFKLYLIAKNYNVWPSSKRLYDLVEMYSWSELF